MKKLDRDIANGMPQEVASMTLAEARQAINANETTQMLANIAKALGMLPMLNTKEDWRRKRAAELILAERRRQARNVRGV